VGHLESKERFAIKKYLLIIGNGQNNFPKHVELNGIINKPLLLHLVGCLYYLYQ